MKTKQPMKDIAPLLIRKVSGSTKPVSTFLEQINVKIDRSIFDLKSQTTGQLNDRENLNIQQDRRLSVLELQTQSVHTARKIPKSNNSSGPFFKEKGDFYEGCKVKQRPSLIANKSSVSVYSRNKQQISRMSLSKEVNSAFGFFNISTVISQ